MAEPAKKTVDLLKERAELFKNVFGGTNGQRVLNELRVAFMADPFDPDPIKMAGNVGAQRPVRYIDHMIAAGKGIIKLKPYTVKTVTEPEHDSTDVNYPEEV